MGAVLLMSWQAIVDSFAWVQDELSSKPHTFNHGDVKPPNMFMMPVADVEWNPRSPPEPWGALRSPVAMGTRGR